MHENHTRRIARRLWVCDCPSCNDLRCYYGAEAPNPSPRVLSPISVRHIESPYTPDFIKKNECIRFDKTKWADLSEPETGPRWREIKRRTIFPFGLVREPSNWPEEDKQMLIGDGVYSLRLSELDYTIWRVITENVAVKLGTIEGAPILEIRVPVSKKMGYDIVAVELPPSTPENDGKGV